MGPPFNAFGPGMKLDYGITKAPLTYEPPVGDDPTVLESAEPGAYRLPNLAGIPVVVMVGETSPFSSWGHLMSDYVNAAGGSAEFVNFADQGVRGNGHAMMFEKNSDEAIVPVLDWLAKVR